MNEARDLGTSKKSDYDSIEPLGKGGFGHVYRARHKLVGKFYAVKIVDGEDYCLFIYYSLDFS
uniref:Protein kinase domain-containing protein n=1 Tax=Stegastes partitus TaxID=144197 RepID=A0A3B4ZM59_9TELE